MFSIKTTTLKISIILDILWYSLNIIYGSINMMGISRFEYRELICIYLVGFKYYYEEAISHNLKFVNYPNLAM